MKTNELEALDRKLAFWIATKSEHVIDKKNAKLVHDLLFALETLMNYVGGWDEKPPHPCGIARAAIAKARGES